MWVIFLNNYNFERFINKIDSRNNTTYVVKPGDSLYKIANMYNVSINDLMQANKLDGSMIYPNQIIIIPTGYKDNNFNSNNMYVTSHGETLNSISNKLNIPVSKLIDNNDISNLKLDGGNKIMLNDDNSFLLENDMELDDILEKYRISERELIILNKDKWIKSGEKIIIK